MIGFTITGFNIMSFNYPKEIQEMINKTASFGMVGDMRKLSTNISILKAWPPGKCKGGSVASGYGRDDDGNENRQRNVEGYG